MNDALLPGTGKRQERLLVYHRNICVPECLEQCLVDRRLYQDDLLRIDLSCQRCYHRKRADRKHYAGLRDNVLERDRHRCRGCQAGLIDTVLAVLHPNPAGLRSSCW